MKSIILLILFLCSCSTSFACVYDSNVVYENEFANKNFVIQTIPESRKLEHGIFKATAKIVRKSRIKADKSCILEQYVVNCKKNTSHVENSVSYYDNRIIGKNPKTKEKTIDELTFVSGLRDKYCDPTKEPIKFECTNLESTHPRDKMLERKYLESQGKIICE